MPHSPDGHDADLGVAFAAGTAELRELYDRHGGLVYGLCRKALGEPAAGEVTQDVFVSAWQARSQFDPAKGTLGAWLVGIAKRRIVDHVRREHRHRSRQSADADVVTNLPDRVDDDVERMADRMRVAAALQTLPERSREVIGLAYVHGLTHQEIADRTALPLGTIKSDIRRGLATLRERMEQGDE